MRTARLAPLLLLLVVASARAQDPTVYRTKTGKAYHTATCRHLSKSKIAITLSEARKRHLKPCKDCKPPR